MFGAFYFGTGYFGQIGNIIDQRRRIVYGTMRFLGHRRRATLLRGN